MLRIHTGSPYMGSYPAYMLTASTEGDLAVAVIRSLVASHNNTAGHDCGPVKKRRTDPLDRRELYRLWKAANNFEIDTAAFKIAIEHNYWAELGKAHD
ncbi:MAG: hypothetical protein Q9216_000406 [Gyalolechia sp. 2 TL-2023]